MLPILGTPMIEWNIKRFLSYGVTSFLINLHYLPDILRRFVGDGSQWGADITYNFEREILGTAGGVKAFEPYLDDEFFVMYGDIFSHLDYGAMELVWRTKPDALGMQIMSKTSDYEDADVAELAGDSRVVAVHPKPHFAAYPNPYRMRGVFLFRRDAFSYVAPGEYMEIGRDLIPAIVAKHGAFYGYESHGYSRGIDTLDKWKEVEAHLIANGFPDQGFSRPAPPAAPLKALNSKSGSEAVVKRPKSTALNC